MDFQVDVWHGPHVGCPRRAHGRVYRKLVILVLKVLSQGADQSSRSKEMDG